jgi:hypothetical protein
MIYIYSLLFSLLRLVNNSTNYCLPIDPTAYSVVQHFAIANLYYSWSTATAAVMYQQLIDWRSGQQRQPLLTLEHDSTYTVHLRVAPCAILQRYYYA